MNKYKIYGDNIIECFRVINLIKQNTFFSGENLIRFQNTSTVTVQFLQNEKLHSDFIFELIPGFDKSRKKRWKDNILDYLKDSGGDLDETADAIITKINQNNKEEFLLIIEFCSALQAGNQAWQRSGRAYSIGKTDIPYLYVVDFTRYELDSKTREKKALRFPNALVPYSYISYTELIDNPVLQAYFKSEEFDSEDELFKGINFDKIFAEQSVSNYIANLVLGKSTEQDILDLKKKNLEMVYFLAQKQDGDSSLNRDKIELLNASDLYNSVDEISDIHFKKIIAEKSINGNIKQLNELISNVSKGIFGSSLPFGLISEDSKPIFTNGLRKIYNFDENLLVQLENSDKVVITLMKGFKPAGDDNRPDRGILPLLRMLFGDNVTIITVLYGPIIGTNYGLLKTNQGELAKRNGLWQTIIYLSDYLITDSPVIKSKKYTATQEIFSLKQNKFDIRENKITQFKALNTAPVGFREDDVDTLLYTLFSYNVKDAFVGLCNPPGGDWSGFSLINENEEKRWLSLPRVSEVGFKRPDHVIQLTGIAKPLLLIIESKDKPTDLENNIGPRLNGYIEWLMNYVPNVSKRDNIWTKCVSKINSDSFSTVSCGSFIDKQDKNYTSAFENWKCDLILTFNPNGFKSWNITIFHNSKPDTLHVVNTINKSFTTNEVIKKIKLVNVSPV